MEALQNQTAAFYTLGCKLNFAETSTIARQFLDEGFRKVAFEEGADVYVINTCSVTDHADRKTKRVVAEAKRQNPKAKVVIVGCYAQLKPAEIASIPGVDLVLGAREKFNILSFLQTPSAQLVSDENAVQSALVHNTHIKEARYFIPSYSLGDRTRTFLKVQDGCDYFCAFCTIPLARGRSRNETIAATVKVAQEVALTDAREVVLTGVNIGDYGKSTGENFFDLIRKLQQIEGIDRFRISSIEPNLLSNDIIEWIAREGKRFLPHFHIPLQSGSDAILEKMRRRYLTSVYTARVGKIRECMPDACIGVDVIVGFPGETDEEFLTTYNYLNELDISYLHVFTYSERPNTTALRIPDVVPVKVRKERTAKLRILGEKKRDAFYRKHLSEIRPVLWEAENDGGFMYGFTDNYIKVKTEYDPAWVNEILNFELKQVDSDGVVAGKLIFEPAGLAKWMKE